MPHYNHVYYEQQLDTSLFSRSHSTGRRIEDIETYQNDAWRILNLEIGQSDSEMQRQKIVDYFKALSLIPPPLLLFNASEATLKRIADFEPLSAQLLKGPGNLGTYSNNLNVALVALNRAVDSQHLAVNIVHESTHGASLKSYRTMTLDSAEYKYYATRGGYMVEAADRKVRNNFIDEGRAGLLASHFASRNYPPRPLRMNTSLGLEVPNSYIYESSPSTNTTCNSTPAAIALEMLIVREPELLPAIIAGPTCVEGLRQTARVLNGIQVGLYSKLSVINHSGFAFDCAAKELIDKLYGGDLQAPLEAHEEVKLLLDNLIENRGKHYVI